MAAANVLHARSAGQPDIHYVPDYQKFLQRGTRRQETEYLKNDLPDEFPCELLADSVWDGRDVGKKFDWTYKLDACEIEEIDHALAHFKGMDSKFALVFSRSLCLSDCTYSAQTSTRLHMPGHFPVAQAETCAPRYLSRAALWTWLQSASGSACEYILTRGQCCHICWRFSTHRPNPW